MNETSQKNVSIGGTSAAPTIKKSTSHVTDTTGSADTTPSPSTPPAAKEPSLRHEPVVGGPEAQLAQADRLRNTRDSSYLPMVAAGLALLAVGVALYFTVIS